MTGLRAVLATAMLIAALAVLGGCAGTAPAVKPEAPLANTSAAPQEPEAPFSLPEQKSADKAPKSGALLEAEAEDKYLILNFENSDIQTIIATFSELLNINYILTPGISGTVTIQSYKRFPTKNLFEIFQNILEMNGLTAVKRGDFYLIIPIDTAKTQPMDVQAGREHKVTLDSAFNTQLIPLEYIKASEIANILKELMPRGTNMIVYEPSNMLIVTALPHAIAKFTKIIEALDISSLDTDAVQTFVYYVENGSSKKLEEILKTVYLSSKGSSGPATTVLTATGKPAAAVPKTTPIAPAARASEGVALPGELGDITITSYEDINALIIKSAPRDYIALLKILKNIDIAPRQVLIEVLIGEVTLGDKLEYGLEWLLKLQSGNYVGYSPGRFFDTSGNTVTTTSPTDSDSGLLSLSSGTWGNSDFISFFTAIASDNELNVLASPNILALDNKEAEIKIGNEVPTATSTTQSTEGITTSSQIQYKTVGTILNVTPHITEKGNVSMKIVVESSDVGTSTRIGTGDYPSFITRKATTNAVVKNGHTLFLGGLISEKKTSSGSGIPFLMDIPILGYLFRSHSNEHAKTEMFVLVTPYVITNQDDADRVSRDSTRKVNKIMDKLSKSIRERKRVEAEGEPNTGNVASNPAPKAPTAPTTPEAPAPKPVN